MISNKNGRRHRQRLDSLPVDVRVDKNVACLSSNVNFKNVVIVCHSIRVNELWSLINEFNWRHYDSNMEFTPAVEISFEQRVSKFAILRCPSYISQTTTLAEDGKLRTCHNPLAKHTSNPSLNTNSPYEVLASELASNFEYLV